MKALILSAYNVLDLVDMDDPVPGRDEVLIQVGVCGICGSDIHGMDGSSGRRIPPVVMGHEAAGTIVAVGEEVTTHTVGERVTFDSTVYCGACRHCREGRPNLCDNRRVLGVSCDEYRRDGAFAEYVSVPERILYTLPEGVSFEQAALTEPLSIAVHAVSLAGSVFGLRTVVVGAGVIGSLVVSVLRASGCESCTVIDPDPTRRERVLRMGAESAVSPGDAIPGGEADLVVEAVGGASTVDAAIGLVRKGGTVVLVGNVTPQVSMPLQKTVTRELRLLGSCGSAGEYDLCLSMLGSGLINAAEIISEVAPMYDGARWFSRLYKREPGLLKVLLRPDA